MPTVAEPAAPAPAGAEPSGDAAGRLPAWWPWGVGLLLGLVVLGPGLGGGALLSLDLLVTPDIPVPNGVYGLGPALSQRVPLFALLGLGSAIVGGPVITKLLLVASVACGFAGAARLVRVLAPRPVWGLPAAQLAAGLLWAGGPFALTRIGAGHVNLWWAIAVLPWVLPRLCRPADHLPSTFLASLAMAVGGPGGGTLGLAVAAVGLVLQPSPRRWLRPALAIAAPHAIWVLPTAALLWAGAGVTGAGGFATDVDGWPALAVGDGFWRWDLQVGGQGGWGIVAGLVVLVAGGVGMADLVRRHGWRSWQGAATAAALAGLVLAAASAVPGIRGGYDWLSELPVGAPLRESHRFLALWLVWAAPVAPLGAASLARRAGAARPAWSSGLRLVGGIVPVAVALVVSVPGWWGLEGRLEPVDYPSGWAAARAVVRAEPGTVVALPWSEYPPLSFADGRQVFNPVPEYLGGDVISSYDPVFDPDEPSQEQVDGRAVPVDRIADRAFAGAAVGDDLAELGVRWVVVVHEGRWQEYDGLPTDPGLRRRLDLPDLDLYEVVGWPGEAVAPDGTAHRLDRPVTPILTTDAPEGSILNVAGAPGWIQGWGSPAEVTDDGRLRLTGSGGVVWFWPAPVLLAVDLAVLVGAVIAVRSRTQKFGRILA